MTWRITYKFNINTAITFFYSFVFSALSYGVIAWGGLFFTQSCSRILALFRRIVLNLFSWHFPGKSFTEICVSLGILNPIDIFKLNIMLFYYNIVNLGFLPQLQFDDRVVMYEHRAETDLVVPFPRTNVIKSHHPYLIPLIWNEVPGLIKNSLNSARFKKLYKEHLLKSFRNDYITPALV